MKLCQGYGTVFSVIIIAMLSGCGSLTGTVSSSASQLATLDALPTATAAVESGATTSINKNVNKLGTSATGMLFGAITRTDFTSSMSLAACEMFNQSKQAINQAAQGDLIQCYVTSTFDAFATRNSISLYDGAYHVFDLVFGAAESSGGGSDDEEDDGGPDKIKVKVVRGDNDAIESFEMLSCKNGSQDMYLKQEIADSIFAMTTIYSGSYSTGTFTDTATVTGRIDSSGNFVDSVDGVATPKIIHMQHVNVDTTRGDDFYGDLTFNQTSDSATLTGTMSGSNTNDGQSCTFTNNVFGSVALIDDNEPNTTDYKIGLLGLGDGAVTGAVEGGCGTDTWTDTFTSAWTGADALALADATTSSHHSVVADATVATISRPSIVFGTDQSWDCADTAEATINFEELAEALGSNPLTSCTNLEMTHSHIDCWHIMGDQNSN